jgi:hypothetical protein
VSRVLLTGGRAPVALELARQFAAGGDTVFVADSARHFLARSSRAIAGAFQVPSPRFAPAAFVDAIAAIVASRQITRIVPTCEEVFYLAALGDRLRSATELFCPSLDVLALLHDKWSFSELADSMVATVRVPPTWLVTSAVDLERLSVPPTDLVLKPVFSRFAAHTLIRPSRAQLGRLTPAPDHAWVAQRYIAGRELCTYSVARGGTLTAHAAYAPTWRAGASSSFYFSPVDCPALEDFAATLAAKLHYTGQLGFDFIQQSDGTVYVLECNPRATSGVHLFGPSDGLRAAFEGTAGGVVHPGSHRPAMLASAMLLVGLSQALRSHRVRRLIADCWRARDAIWSPNDPRPTAYLFVGLADYLALARRFSISPVAASTHDIEWDGGPIR